MADYTDIANTYNKKLLSAFIKYADKEALQNTQIQLIADQLSHYVMANDLNEIKYSISTLINNISAINNYIYNTKNTKDITEADDVDSDSESSDSAGNYYNIISYVPEKSGLLNIDKTINLDLSKFILDKQLKIQDQFISDQQVDLDKFYLQIRRIFIDSKEIDPDKQYNIVSETTYLSGLSTIISGIKRDFVGTINKGILTSEIYNFQNSIKNINIKYGSNWIIIGYLANTRQF